ncbi:MAG: tetratricopeptide repeat protein, partial [Bacteroidota bacterium]
MRRFGFLFFFTLILIWPSLGQFQTVDSLLKVVESASTPIIKLRALNELAWEQKSTDPDAATAHVREAMRLARSLNNEAEIGKSFKIMCILHWYASDMKACRTKLDSALMYFQRINDRKGEADVINNLALSYHVSGDLGQAGILYQKTLDIRKEIQDREGMISNHNNLGVLFFDLGMYPDALASYQEALALMQQTGDQSKLGNAYLNIGNIHFKQKSHEEAMKAFQKALDVFEQDQDLRSMADAYVNMGQVADALGKPDEAEQHYRMSLRFFEEVEDQLGISENLRNVGNMLSNQEAGKEALPLIQKSLKISQDIGDLPGVVKASIDLARHYQQQNQLVLASSQLDQAVHIATQQEMRPELIEAYDLLASIYAKQGRYEDAYRFAGREEALEDSMYTLEQARTFSFQSAKMDLTTKKLENANLIKDIKLAETQASAQRMKFTLALTIATAIGVLAILLFETNRKKTRQNIVLQDQNHRIRMQKAQIEAQNEELEDKNGQLKKLDQEKNDLMGMVA